MIWSPTLPVVIVTDPRTLLITDFSYGTLLVIGASVGLLAVVAFVTTSCRKKKDSSVNHSDNENNQQIPRDQHTCANQVVFSQLERWMHYAKPVPFMNTSKEYENGGDPVEENGLKSRYGNERQTYVNLAHFTQEEVYAPDP
ncbi:hypothetical protein ECG_09553 [Echinococcus granulosus]|nr:hypothetical protein ECG_09553 [Echinococcus granulosus]